MSLCSALGLVSLRSRWSHVGLSKSLKTVGCKAEAGEWEA